MNGTSTTLAPAPWQLEGCGYIALLRFAAGSGEQDRFLPPGLQGRRGGSRYAWMMFVDYRDSDVGPYHELLFIPGRFEAGEGHRALSISRIFVSSQDSVINGQRNWGIPKALAQFDVRYGVDGVDRVAVHQDGQSIATLAWRSAPLSLPFSTALVPRGLRTLAQHHEGRGYLYTPSARGWVRPAWSLEMQSNPALFADLSAARAVLGVKVSRFSMCFPESRMFTVPPSVPEA